MITYRKSDIPKHLQQYFEPAEIGLEDTPAEYVEKMVEVFRGVKRVLRDDGTLWLNLGDSYAGGGRGCDTPKQRSNKGTQDMPKSVVPAGLKPKDLIGIPWRVAFALQADGWYLRQDIIWSKPNPMPESVTDRCTKAHEYIFLLSKSPRYYYDADAVKEPVTDSTVERLSQDIENQRGSERVPNKTNGNMKAVAHKSACTPGQTPHSKALKCMNGEKDPVYVSRNKRSVWTVTTKPYKGAHFATFPPDLIRPCILAGCPQKGTVLDCFGGSGTTGMVAEEEGRSSVLIELNPEYVELGKKRTQQMGLFT